MADHVQSLVGVTKVLFLSILIKYSFAVNNNGESRDRAYKLADNSQGKKLHNLYRRVADDFSISKSHDSPRNTLHEDFYTSINNSTIDKKTIFVSFINNVHKEKAAIARRKLEMRQFQAKHPPERFRLMDRFQHAITKGDLPLYERQVNDIKSPNSYWSHIKSNLLHGSFVEIGNCYTAYLAAESTPNMTVLAYTTKESSAYCMTKSQLSQLENFFVGQHDPDHLSETFKLLYEDSQVLFGNLLLSNLITMTRNLLPHEFEERLARVLSLALVTFVLEPATDKDREVSFFKSQWPVFSTLLENSCEIAGLNCDVSKLSSYAGSWIADDVNIYKVMVRYGVRNLPPSFCQKFRRNQKCSLLFSTSAASNSSIVFSDNVNISASASISSFSLSTILQLNPFPFTINHLFLRLIAIPYNGTRSPKRLLVTHNGMTVAPKLRLETKSDDEDEKEAHELKRFNKNVKTLNKIRIYNDNLVIMPVSQDQISVERLILDEDSTQNAHIEKNRREIDSWERQWQRESHPGPPSAKKDSDELDSVNALVNREDVRKENENEAKQKSNEGKFVDDAELSKDEKELKQAMGFLYGHHKSVEIDIIEEKDFQNSKNQIISSENKNDINQMQIQKPNMIIAPEKSKKDFENLVQKESLVRKPILGNKFEKKSPETDTQYQVPAPVIQKGIHVAAEVMNKVDALSMADRHSSPISRQKKAVKKVPRAGKMKKGKSQKTIIPPPAQSVTDEERKGDKYRSDRNPSSRQLLSAEKSLTNEFNDRLLKFKANVFENQEARKQSAMPNTVRESTSKEILNTTEKAQEEAVTRMKRRLTTEAASESTVQPTEKTTQFHWLPHSFTPKMKEEGLYDYHWHLICNDLHDTAQSDSHFTVLTFGNLQQSLIGSKIAMLYPQASVVSVMPYGYQKQEDQHRKTMGILPYGNYLLLKNRMDAHVINSLNSFPELMTFQVLGIEIFQPALALGPGYLYYLGQLLTLARTTYIQLPDPAQLVLAKRLFTKNHSNFSILYTNGVTIMVGDATITPSPVVTNLGAVLDDHLTMEQQIRKGFISDALRLVGATAQSLAVLGDSEDDFHGHRLLKIQLKTLHRKVTVNCSSASEAALHLEPDGTSFVEIRGSMKQFKPARVGEGVGLEFLLELGLFNDERSLLFSEYLSLSVHRDMCPTHIVWFNQTLVYHPINRQYPSLYIDVEAQRSAQNQVMTGVLISQVGEEPFSFMDYNSRDGQIIHSLSTIFQNSTFISLLEDKKHAMKLYTATQDKNTENLAISIMKIKQDFTRKLLKSPDILRYQYMGLSELLELLFTYSRQTVNQLLGEILATGVSTFIQVPSAEMLSLAMMTLYPDAIHTVVPEDTSDETRYLRARHPLYLYRNAEVRLISESAKADVAINISAHALSPPLAANDAQYPWKLLRLDVRNLTVKVDHHFDYKLDGHTRKYTQHCLSYNASHYEVYLIRDLDGFKIPYGNVHAISLIALLRMGLMDEIKTRFYDLFLKLPFYEDMAPWNIVFRGGKLDYIDYDSKDVTFNKMVPAAYQVMAMLMNYERTITDFGHCKEGASTQYGFSLIAHCVKSDYDGPCLDSRYPVPCGDHTCRSTYIECLQALSDLEKIKTKNNAHSSSENSGYQNSAEQMPLADQWSYDKKGPLKANTVS